MPAAACSASQRPCPRSSGRCWRAGWRPGWASACPAAGRTAPRSSPAPPRRRGRSRPVPVREARAGARGAGRRAAAATSWRARRAGRGGPRARRARGRRLPSTPRSRADRARRGGVQRLAERSGTRSRPSPGSRWSTVATRWPGSSSETSHGSVEPDDPVRAGDALQGRGGDDVHLDVLDRDVPFGADGVPGDPAVLRDVVEGVPEHVAVQAGDRLVRVPDAQLRCRAREVLTARRRPGRSGELTSHRRRGPQVGDVAEDPVAVGRAEVVVDHLDDLGAAVLERPSRRPTAAPRVRRSTRGRDVGRDRDDDGEHGRPYEAQPAATAGRS